MRNGLLQRIPSTAVANWLGLILLLLVGFGVRLIDLQDPPLDFHPVRQLHSAIIARGAYFSLDTSADPTRRQAAIASAAAEIYEPPILEQIVGFAYYLAGSEQLWIARVFSILFWLIGGFFLFLLARRHTSFTASLVGLAFYLCLPFAIIASRSFQPDPWMVMWILVTAWSADHWMETPTWKWTILTGLLGGLAILIKAMAAFFIGGVLVMAVLANFGIGKLFRSFKPWVMAALVLAPAALYYLILNTGKSAGYFTFWTLGFAGMLVTSKFYVQWLAMVNSLVGMTLLVVGLLGIIIAAQRFRVILIGLWIGYLLFGIAWPFQYTTHDYYHLALIPVIGLSITPVVEVFVQKLLRQALFWRLVGIGIFLAAAGFELYVGRSQLVANNFSLEPRSWQLVGEAIPPEESFVALTSDYGARLNYFGWRNAAYNWPTQDDLEVTLLHDNSRWDIPKLFREVTQGRSYFLVTALGELDAQPELKSLLVENYPVYHQGSGWLIYDLKHPFSKH